jgi:hypothetical protein
LPAIYDSAVSASFLYQIIADSIVVLHGLFILFVLLGGILCISHPKAVWLHLPCVFWGVVVELTGWVCPLTYLENSFRLKSGGVSYGGDFIMHYLEPVIYPEGLTREVQLLFGVIVLLMNAAVYGFLILRKRKG